MVSRSAVLRRRSTGEIFGFAGGIWSSGGRLMLWMSVNAAAGASPPRAMDAAVA